MRTQRWVHAAIAGLVGAAAVTGAGLAHAASTSTPAAAPSTFVPIVPCRLADTRGDSPVGNRATPLTGGEEAAFQVTGSNGQCAIPPTATGIAANITFDRPTTAGYLTVFPADAPRPGTSNLNWTPDSPPTPNQVTVKLSVAGAIKAYNSSGEIDLIIDLVGYYQPAGTATSGGGPTGPAGPAGAVGPSGPVGPRGTSSWDTIPSGQTVTGSQAWLFTAPVAGSVFGYTTSLPAGAPVSLTDTTINFSAGEALATDADPACTGSLANPTAPAGKVCIYLAGAINATGLFGSRLSFLSNKAFEVIWTTIGTGAGVVQYSWAYTAP